jgi:siroheme synthase-like protein
MTNSYLPVSVSTKDRPCLVVGGGRVALRKIETLLEYKLKITVVAPQPQEKIEFYAEKGRLTLEKRKYKSPEASSYGIVISASDDKAVNKLVFEDCKRAGVLINVVDNPPLCNFIFPAVVRRESLTVAVSTDGKAPFLSGHLRSILENIFPDHWNKMMRLASVFRKKVQERWPEDIEQRMACFGRFVEADWKSLIKEKSDEELESELDRMLES